MDLMGHIMNNTPWNQWQLNLNNAIALRFNAYLDFNVSLNYFVHFVWHTQNIEIQNALNANVYECKHQINWYNLDFLWVDFFFFWFFFSKRLLFMTNKMLELLLFWLKRFER